MVRQMSEKPRTALKVMSREKAKRRINNVVVTIRNRPGKPQSERTRGDMPGMYRSEEAAVLECHFAR
jgi:hypothetical protein